MCVYKHFFHLFSTFTFMSILLSFLGNWNITRIIIFFFSLFYLNLLHYLILYIYILNILKIFIEDFYNEIFLFFIYISWFFLSPDYSFSFFFYRSVSFSLSWTLRLTYLLTFVLSRLNSNNWFCLFIFNN